MTDWAEDLERDGFAITEGVLGSQETDRLLQQLTPVVETLDGRAGSRALLRRSPAIAALAHSEEFLHFIRPVLGDSAVPVRAVLFDKRPEANWLVPWHQDLSVVVAKRVDAVGWGQWSEKDGMVHVQPPVSMLESMLTVRLHLDDCGEDNGPLRVLPGSHRLGRLTSQQIQRFRASVMERTCVIHRGGLMVMRPLLLHASSRAHVPSHRRVVHVEYASGALPPGMEWTS